MVIDDDASYETNDEIERAREKIKVGDVGDGDVMTKTIDPDSGKSVLVIDKRAFASAMALGGGLEVSLGYGLTPFEFMYSPLEEQHRYHESIAREILSILDAAVKGDDTLVVFK